MVGEIGTTSTESFDALKKDIPVDLALYAMEKIYSNLMDGIY